MRLFQEYVRSYEKLSSVPDGRFGPGSQRHLKRWIDDHTTAGWAPVVAKWEAGELGQTEYLGWLALLEKATNVKEMLEVEAQLRRLIEEIEEITQGVITVNPRHRAFYTKVLGFVPLGLWRAYPTVQGHPAEAYYIDPKLMQAKVPRIFQQMFGEQVPLESLHAAPMPPNLVRFFGSHSTQTNRRLVEEILQYVEDYGSLRRW